MESTAAKCAHPACKCSVTGGKRFCSTYCEQHMGQTNDSEKVACRCGHPDCGPTEAAS